MAKTITLRDIKTNEALYPDVLVTSVHDSEGNNLVSVLSKKADLVDGIVPLSQLPAVVVTGGDSLKGVIVNGVTGSLDVSTGSANVVITGKNLDLSKDYKTVLIEDAPVGYNPIVSESSLDTAISVLESNVISVRTDINKLVTIIGVENESYVPESKIYISEAKTLKQAVDILDASLDSETKRVINYVDELFEWEIKN